MPDQRMHGHDRTDEEWEIWHEELRIFIEERARMRRVTSYSEANLIVSRRAGLRPFDFEHQSERNAMGGVLGAISVESVLNDGPMISAIVMHVSENRAGGGFYDLGVKLGLLVARPTSRQRDEFWTRQVNRTFEHLAAPKRKVRR